MMLDYKQENIRAILFDLDGTLRVNRPSGHDVFYHFARRMGAVVSIQNWRKALRWAHYYWASSDDIKADIHTHGAGSDEFWAQFALRYLNAFGVSGEVAEPYISEMVYYFGAHHRPQNYVPRDVFPTLEALRSRGYQIGLVTNRSNGCEDELQVLGLAEYFEFVVVAGTVGSWKPEPGIFQHALAQTCTAPDQTIYVGDNFYADILGAQAVGMLPVLIDPHQAFPEAECPVIETLGGLLSVLNHA